MGSVLTNLNVNPCKMCMPMGAVAALAGIRNCMSILHGSQGCATYIRRHMATHYNEPVDIASSSLTEQGTVFGGEANLLKGLANLEKQYSPDVIGVATTCLAETIGEDIKAITEKYRRENPGSPAIITVSSPGYGGTQNEGFLAALRAVTEQAGQLTAPTGKVNVVTPMLSPADTRWLKALFASSGLDIILLPDLSENLDGVSGTDYNKLKSGGTPLEDIRTMAGSCLTVEFSLFTDEKNSVADYLEQNYSVPSVKLPLPTGIRAIDRLFGVIRKLGGVIPESYMLDRGRYLDAMVDNHKYAAGAKMAVFGDPDYVLSVVRLAAETGISPVLVATGSVMPGFREAVQGELDRSRDYLFLDRTEILDDCDFETIEELCGELGVNVMVGSSEARRITWKTGIPLIRSAFPIHDHVGGQRVRTLGFEGSLHLLDSVCNAVIDQVESTFRTTLLEEYKPKAAKVHPCFSQEAACRYSRMHLPVAAGCNIQCNYCLRDCDCVNETRPGVTSRLVTPEEALERFRQAKKTLPDLSVAAVAGPGESLFDFERTRQTLSLIRAEDPDITFCIATNGLMLPEYVPDLLELGVSHVTVTVNAVDIKIASQVVRQVEYKGRVLQGEEAAAVLIANQLRGIRLLSEQNVAVKVNIVLLKGVNEDHIPEIVRTVKALGAEIVNIMPHIPVQGTPFENLERVSGEELRLIRDSQESIMPQMRHCVQCRSDACGKLGSQSPAERTADRETVLIAVTTRSGILVDQHFGHCESFQVFRSDGTDAQLIETRPLEKYCSGKTDCDDKEDRWTGVIRALEGVSAVLTLRIGDIPQSRLTEAGIETVITCERIGTAVAEAAGNILSERECVTT